MRISDWSSDVCSSDLACEPLARARLNALRAAQGRGAERVARSAGLGRPSPACGRRCPQGGGGGERSELPLLFFLHANRNAKIKRFRAVTARDTFLCLCKTPWRQGRKPRLHDRKYQT